MRLAIHSILKPGRVCGRACSAIEMWCAMRVQRAVALLSDLWKRSSTGPPQGATDLFLQELGDVLVEEGFVGGACAGAGGVAPERRDGEQGAVVDVLRLVLRVGHR